ncbi:MAG: cytochrome c3 family protein, partial [Candidatus Methanoperedens sp.]|nr:cytochrome c3 family protein [Candidatus Methanoperedens sp.]
GWAGDYCTVCHQNYDGNPTTSNAGGGPAKDFTTTDTHRNIRCDNSSCHDPNGTSAWNNHNTGGITIGSCTNASCHPLRNDISMKSTLNGVVSNYSNTTVATGTYDKYHTPNSTVPCIICHGPMHNISKPDPSTGSLNTITEDTQCTTCHSSYKKHNASLNCTLCHSDDVHDIQVFAQNATYVDLNHNNPNPARGNCTTCHQNASFLAALKNQSKAGNYTGRLAPQVQTPLNHSDDPLAGKKWNQTTGYWTNGTSGSAQYTSCLYCHGKTIHNNTGLGRVSLFDDNNRVNSTISNTTTWCASCHWQNYSVGLDNYAKMVNTFKADNLLVPPEISGNATYGANKSNPAYFSHTGFASYNDSACDNCHGSLSTSANITGLMHNAAEGTAGGVNCTSCHNIGGQAGHDVDITNMGNGAHANLSNRSQYTGGNITNRKCWACHGTLNANGYANETDQPVDSHNTSMYKNPRECTNCHNNTYSTSNFSAPQVVEHRDGAPVVTTPGIICSICHNNSLTTINENDGFGITNPQNATASHYLKDANINLMTTTNHSNDCRWCHIINNLSTSWGTPFNPKNSSKFAHSDSNIAQNENCYGCHGNLPSSVKLHDKGITRGGAGGQNCVSCHDGTTGKSVNVDNMNKSDSIHLNLNLGGTYNGRSENRMCYACHTNDSYINASGVVNNNTIPVNSHPTGYDTPKNCTLCHRNANQNYNFSARMVSEHYYGGDEIKTKLYINYNDSCIACHIESEMLRPFSDNSGTKYSNVSHYGKSRNNTLLVSNNVVNCKYCHYNGTSTKFDFTFSANRTISNHSLNYPTTSPNCTDCHREGRQHDSNLTIPALNDTLCISCHVSRQEHNNSVQCINCHVNSSASRDKAHPIRYINSTGKFNTSNISSADCQNCHQGAGVTGFSNATKVSSPLNHSNDNAGQKWGNYWGGVNTSCDYCHGDTRHNASALGKPSKFKGNNKVDQTDLTQSTWCLGCHVNGSANYNNMKGNLSPIPPQIKSGYPYYNASGTDHAGFTINNDNDCTTCHKGNTSSITAYMHNLGIADTNNCISCHTQDQRGYPAINLSLFTRHSNVNTTGGQNNLTNDDCTTCHYNFNYTEMNQTGFTTNTKVCSDCHTQGNYSAKIIKNHVPGTANISTPASCSDCHNNSISKYAYSKNASAGHYGTNISLIDTTYCTWCHKNSVNSTKWGNATDPWNSTTFPHGIDSTPREDCYACHGNVSTTNFHNVTLYKPLISSINCLDCHRTDRTMAPKEVDAGVFTTGVHKNRSCDNCHSNATDTNMNGTYLFSKDAAKTCTYCHTGSGNFSAPLVNEHTQVGKEVITATATCNTCHDNSGMYLPNTGTNGSSTAISHYVKDVTNRSTIPYQHFGPINTTNCLNCHNGPNTSNPIWGSPVNISTSSLRPHTETQNSQCDTCHKDNSISSLSLVDFHNASVKLADTNDCISCHTQDQRGYPAINLSLFTRHSNVNTTGGQNNLTNDDCTT